MMEKQALKPELLQVCVDRLQLVKSMAVSEEYLGTLEDMAGRLENLKNL